MIEKLVFIALPLNGKCTPSQTTNVRAVLNSIGLNIKLVFTGSENSVSNLTSVLILGEHYSPERVVMTKNLTETGPFVEVNLTKLLRNDYSCIGDITNVINDEMREKTSAALEEIRKKETAVMDNEHICIVCDFIQVNALLHELGNNEDGVEDIDKCLLVRIGDVVAIENSSLTAIPAAFMTATV